MLKPLNSAVLIRTIFERKAVMSYPGVTQPIQIIIDDRAARHEFFTTALFPFDSILTKNDQGRRSELANIYINSVNTSLVCIEEDFQSYIDAVSNQLDHTQTIFSEEIIANPMVRKAINDATYSLSSYIYFKLFEFKFISDSNIFVLDFLGPDFYLITVYPSEFTL